ncbi:unnamed protein product [Linum trigynum]|uniref:Uncharacterized protein n=1 Tax=Linum trigynum TaxID=586398 RepID=A0AAV2G0H6_9ROSI
MMFLCSFMNELRDAIESVHAEAIGGEASVEERIRRDGLSPRSRRWWWERRRLVAGEVVDGGAYDVELTEEVVGDSLGGNSEWGSWRK